MSNAIFAIKPYKWNGLWVFDDPSVELEREPFVAGIPEMIEAVVKEFPSPDKGFLMLFSSFPFPGHVVHLRKLREDGLGGTWYQWTATNQEGWLCPALLKYYPVSPDNIYVQVKPLLAADN
jgi:hypothetical protein